MNSYNEEVAKLYISQGYRCTSRRYCHISRVDRKDWKEFMIKIHGFADADWYRRCISGDTRVVSSSIIGLIPTSTGDSVGYVE